MGFPARDHKAATSRRTPKIRLTHWELAGDSVARGNGALSRSFATISVLGNVLDFGSANVARPAISFFTVLAVSTYRLGMLLRAHDGSCRAVPEGDWCIHR